MGNENSAQSVEKKRKKIKILLAVAAAVLLGFTGFALRDVILYYFSGIGYVKANYTQTTVEIPCDIEFTVDLTLRAGHSASSQKLALEYPDDPGLYCSQYGRSTYILDDYMGMPHSFTPEEGHNFILQLYWEEDTNNPFTHTVIMPFDISLYEEDLLTSKTTNSFGGGPNYSVPASNITVTVGENTYTPVWYECTSFTDMYGDDSANYYTQFHKLGLFNDPDILDELLDQGVTTATVKIDTLYKTVYKAPGLDKLFVPRKTNVVTSLQEVDGVDKSQLDFSCDFNPGYPIMDDSDEFSMEIEGYRDFLIGEEWSVIPGRRVIECSRNGGIKNINGPDKITIVKAEPIVQANIDAEWALFMTPIYPDSSGHMITGVTPELTEAELNFKFPFTWDKNKTNYIQFRINLLQKDVAEYGIPEEDIQIKVHGVRFYADDGTVYEFYNNDQYEIIKNN